MKRKKIERRKYPVANKIAVYIVLLLIILSIPLTLLSISQRVNTDTHASSNNLTASGTSLLLNGNITQFTGVNAYEIATNLTINPGCGPSVNNPDTFFSTLRPHSLVRIWGFEGSMAKYNQAIKVFDWTALDAVFSSAAKYNQLIILAIGNQWGTCDDNRYKDTSFYNGGYNTIYNPNGTTPVSYWNYMQAIVGHFKSNSALGMWELMNEPEAQQCVNGNDNSGKCSGNFTCNESTGEKSLHSFFDAVGKKVQQLDPNHLVESGIIGSGQCGSSGNDYQSVHASSGINVASYHDYGNDNSPLPGDKYNGLQVRLNQMKVIKKPLIIWEVGMKAQNSVGGCMTLQQRVNLMSNKMNAQFAAGIAAFIPWDWMPSSNKNCIYETITDSDPLMNLLHNYPLLGNLADTTTHYHGSISQEPFAPSIMPLQVSINSPEANTLLVPGQIINLTAISSDETMTSTVSFFINNTFVCSSSGKPFACTWVVPSVPNFQYTIVAKAIDSQNNTTISNATIVYTQ